MLLGLNWIQTACQGYQQIKKVAVSRERVNAYVSSKGSGKPVHLCNLVFSHRDGTFENLQRMFWLRNKKNIFFFTHSYLGA